MPTVRNMQLVTPASDEYKFEMTDGSGFDKTHYKVYVLRDQLTEQPVLSTVLRDGVELFNSKFIADYCFRNGLSAMVQPDKVVLSMKLSTQKSNVFTFMKFYDFIRSIKTLIEFKEIINTNESREEI